MYRESENSLLTEKCSEGYWTKLASYRKDFKDGAKGYVLQQGGVHRNRKCNQLFTHSFEMIDPVRWIHKTWNYILLSF